MTWTPAQVKLLDTRDMDPLAGRAYIAPEGLEEPIRYSGHVELPDGTMEFSLRFDTLSEAVSWARCRTDSVVAREDSRGYFWYGRGPAPQDIEAPPSDF